MAIADWSQSQSLPPSPEMLARKWWNFQPTNRCLSFLRTSSDMKISYVAFPEWSHDIERKFQEFLETLLILSQPSSHETGTVFVVFLQWLCSVVLCLSVYFNNRGMIITWHINIFSWPKEVKDHVLHINTLVENGQNWSWNVILFIFMTDNQRMLVYFSASQMKLQMTCPRTQSTGVVESGQDTIMS